MFIEGQKVVCIDDNFPLFARALYNDFPIKDNIYTIRQVMMGCSPIGSVKTSGMPDFIGKAEVTVLLVEIINPPYGEKKLEMGYKAERFRPMEEISEKEIMSLVKKEPKVIPVKPIKKPDLQPV